MDRTEADRYAHSDVAERSRREKAVALARYLWDRDISADDLAAMPAATRRKLARAAEINPPSSDETWTVVARLLEEKAAWAAGRPETPRPNRDEKILWVKPPVQPW
ncbi:hypothetical protein [Rhodococcoides corynebacterioides]|uniref:Uncharacterized protein n=1 Tax=Rhodococcoides corynebacterioides TaxID=53972 RepID=A0ABS7NYV2_9NOCA|nr:hypothetical protein [Rhodococcus corynebacterioides]MBY6365305.1 hypothetical protein [Rhodococcus corynebacterioides]MBY6408116.1 hypothetical protein [Rhodococcus corynebacterioides]